MVATEASGSLHALPDDVWLLIFAHISLQERHATVPLVCRRWRGLVRSPELLRSAEVQLHGEAWLSSTLGFLHWLAAVAEPGHTQQLGLKVANPSGASEEQAGEVLAALAAACAAAPSLRQLRFDPEAMPLQLGPAWAIALPRMLRRLRLDVVVGELTIAADMRPLTALQALWLDGQPLRLAPDARLPPSITALRLGGDEGAALPAQVAALTRLRRLTLRGAEYDGQQGFALLPQLASLQELLLLHCARLPACLAQLSTLQALLLAATPSDPEGDQEREWQGGLELEPVLRSLTRLTSLVVEDCPITTGIPAAVAGLAQLQRFMWDVVPSAGGALSSGCLPVGPWLGSLRAAAIPAACAAASLRQLLAAPHLEALGMRMFGSLPDEAQRDILLWAAAHSNVRRLWLCCYPRIQLGQAAFAVLLRTQLRKPWLAIEPGSGLFQELAAQ